MEEEGEDIGVQEGKGRENLFLPCFLVVLVGFFQLALGFVLFPRVALLFRSFRSVTQRTQRVFIRTRLEMNILSPNLCSCIIETMVIEFFSFFFFYR